jgi:hypothetical protein
METTIDEIENIKEILSMLPESALKEIKDFAFYLADREKRRKAFEERVLKAEKEPPIRFASTEDAVKAVFDETED